MRRLRPYCACIVLGAAATAHAQLYSNGPFRTGTVTRSGVSAPSGTEWSEVQSNTGNNAESNTLAGSSGAAGTFRLADNFSVPAGQQWTVTDVVVYAYQTGAAPTPSPFVGATLRIWSGRPGDSGSFIMFGDTSTNRLAESTDALAFRIFNTTVPPPGTAPGTTRRIWRNRVAVSPALVLGPGEYWVDYDTRVSNGGNHFHPLRTLVGNRGDSPPQGWNARQLTVSTGVWADVIDAGNPDTAPDVPQDFPFDLLGSSTQETTGGCCFGDGTCRTLTSADCSNAGGSYQGDGTLCSACRGSCCFNNGTCQVLSNPDCNAAGGTYSGNGTNCTSNPCMLPGACCQSDGSCTILTNDACNSAGGTWAGGNTNCGTVVYSVANSNNVYEDILNFATPFDGVDTGNLDDGSRLVQIGFTFNFFGVARTECRLSTNGFLTFGGPPPNTGTNAPIPTAAAPNSLICGLWEDLDLSAGGLAGYMTDGAAPNRRFIVQWRGVPQFATANSANSFEIILYESSDVIEFRYGGIDAIPPRNAVIGVENDTGTAGTSIPNAQITSQSARYLIPGGSITCTQPTGACCTLLGGCSTQLARDCLVQGGLWQRDVTCAAANCMTVGSCCDANGTCALRTSADCMDLGGAYGGDGTVCNPNPCVGACCSGGDCEITSRLACESSSRTYKGNGTVCDPNPCIGACCINDGTCVRQSAADCANLGGSYLGDGSDCAACPAAGRCCTPTDCVILTPLGCAAMSGGVFGGPNTCCEQDPSCTDALWWNGPLGTGRVSLNGTTAPTGMGWAELQNDNPNESNNTLGFAGSNLGTDTTSFRLADDFTVPTGEIWTITSAEFFAYQTQATSGFVPPTPFTAYTVRIWNGRPGDQNSSVIFGNTVDNVLTSSTFAGLERTGNTVAPPPGGAPTALRPIFRNRCTLPNNGVVLPAGTYWIDWQSTITGNAAHFAPSTTVPGARTQAGWNARQFSGATGTWADVLDAGNPTTAPDVAQDFPFRVFGTRQILPGACCLANNTCVILSQNDCQAQMGAYRGNGTSCDPSPCAPPRVAGDMNCDGQRDGDDLGPWILAETDPSGYAAAFPNCNILNGDFNGDNMVTAADAAGMAACMIDCGP